MTNQAIITLGKAYYNQGFFNISQHNSDKFGPDKAKINIQLGDNPEKIISGYINRTANQNGTPRIMGGIALTEWIKKNYKQNDILKIDIISEVSIKLNEKHKTIE